MGWPKEEKKERKKILDSDVFTDEFYQTFKEEITLIFYNHFQSIEAEKIPPTSFYDANITLYFLSQSKDANVTLTPKLD